MLDNNFVPDIRLEPPEEHIFGYCSHCGGELYNEDYVLAGCPVCDECYAYSRTYGAVVDYIRAYPERFFAYLDELRVSDVDFALELLDDYRNEADIDYDGWIAS